MGRLCELQSGPAATTVPENLRRAGGTLAVVLAEALDPGSRPPVGRQRRYHRRVSPRGIEIERKFRLRAAPDPAVLAQHGATSRRIEQVYLLIGPSDAARPDAPEAERVRRTEFADGSVAFRRTTKRRIGAFRFDEAEDPISEADWSAAMVRADPERLPVRKVRHLVPHGRQTLEIDVFERPVGLVVVEVELATEDEPVDLPEWLGEWREVTSDPRYLNVALARRDAELPAYDG
jgi:CYTH domain-containing protein